MGRLTIALTLSLLSIACEPEPEPEPVGGEECYDLFLEAGQACELSGDPEAAEECVADVMAAASDDAAELAYLTIEACAAYWSAPEQTKGEACTACQQAQAQCFGRRSPLVCS